MFSSRQVRRECGQGPENAQPVSCREASAEAQTLFQGRCWAALGSAHQCASLVGSAYDVSLTGQRPCRRASAVASAARPPARNRARLGCSSTLATSSCRASQPGSGLYRASGSVLTTSRSVDPAAAAMLVEIDRRPLEAMAIKPAQPHGPHLRLPPHCHACHFPERARHAPTGESFAQPPGEHVEQPRTLDTPVRVEHVEP